MQPPEIDLQDVLDALVISSWPGGAGLTLTYSIPTENSTWSAYGPGTQPFSAGYGVFNTEQADAFRLAMEQYDSYVAASFVETDDETNTGQIRIAFTGSGANFGAAYFPSDGVGGDIWVSSEYDGFDVDLGPTGITFLYLNHEIGHALGLGHPWESADPLPAQYGNGRYTVMHAGIVDRTTVEFRHTEGGGIGSTTRNGGVIVQTPGPFDIYALQSLYGADPSTRAGATTYSFDADLPVIQTIYDAGGIDTWDLTTHTRASLLDLREGAYSSVDQFSKEQQIEAAVAEFGEASRSFITERLDSAAATLFTWTNNVAVAYGTVIENAYLGEGDDTAIGNAAANVLRGNGGNDTLYGDAGDDNLSGGAGGDVLNGGSGSDTARYSDANGAVVVNLSSIASNTGYAAGDSFISIESLVGSNSNDVLFGTSGANSIDGGEGADAMTGYAGNDVYRVDHSGDVVTEGSSVGGTDRVEARVSFTLGANFENLSLKGAASINATGNTLSNTLIGNGASNILDGKEGADTMIGYAGNDVYRVDHAGDVVTEGSSVGGTDRVEARVSFVLGANVENLSLKGAAAINATGNALSNTLIGNGASNILDGKAGADIMTGYGGNDIYIVNSAGDVVTEGSSVGGVDRVQSSVSFTLGNNLENLTLTGPAPISATGNTLANRLTGNNAANVLDGLAGADTLTGGGGGDAFVFTTALSPSNIDRITDFVHGADMLHLESDVFTALGAGGVLASDAFHLGASAADASDRILYDSATGVLLYDADGNGAGAAVQFATLGAGLGLTNTDILVI